MCPIGIFDIIGPIMIGPSSSHTAGALRIALIAGKLLPGGAAEAEFTLYGSFAHTYRGHGTDRALVAGILGFGTEDERIRDSFAIARERGLKFRFVLDTETKDVHPNTVGILLTGQDGSRLHVTGVSVGGGNVRLKELDGVEIDLSGDYDTLVIKQQDKPGVVAHITKVLSESGVNIAFMRLYREDKGRIAYTIVEADGVIGRENARRIEEHPDILTARLISLREEAAV